MLLVFDVGNTNIVLGLYDGDKMIYHWRAATNELKTADEYAASLGMMFQLDGVPLIWLQTLSFPVSFLR